MSTEELGYAEGWKPEPGARVQGIVTDISATDGGYGTYPVVTLKTEDGREVAVHAFHTVLRKELARRRPGPGDDLDITYLGKKQGGGISDRGYDVYRVRSSKDPQGYDWSKELEDDDPSAARDDDPPIAASPVPTSEPQPPAPSQGEQAAADFGDEPPF